MIQKALAVALILLPDDTWNVNVDGTELLGASLPEALKFLEEQMGLEMALLSLQSGVQLVEPA